MKLFSFPPTVECPHCHGTGKVIDRNAIGRWMRERRKKAGLSLRSTAKRTGISAAYLSDMELGRRMFTANMQQLVNVVIDARAKGLT